MKICRAELVVAGLLACAFQRATPAPKSAPPPLARLGSDCTPAPGKLKAMALAARESNPSDTGEFLAALESAFSVSTRVTNRTESLSIVAYADGLIVTLASPFQVYEYALREQIRKIEPISAAVVPAGYSVSVLPSKVDAPDIIKVIVQRDGVLIRPLLDGLKPKVFTTRMGGKTVLHSGEIVYPCSAFEPGAEVTIAVIPESGSNMLKTLTSEELKLLR